MKKIVILKHGGGELANQLWNYLSIYAFGLETKVPVKNPSFFEYHSFFNFLPQESLATRLFSHFFQTPRRRSHIINRWGRAKYAFKSKFISMLNSRCIFSSENTQNKVTYLPPTSPLVDRSTNCDTLYLCGWLFRNPTGIEKFRNELHTTFTPNPKIIKRLDTIMTPLHTGYEKIVGIHIRQADYKEFKDGKFLVSQDRVRTIINEYIHKQSLDINKTLFLITSDGPINKSLYENLNIYVSKENAVVDLFLLSKTDAILGSDSSFGSFASWYGNIPHIIFKNEAMDWQYYSEKTKFFENKYTSLAQY